MWSSVTSCGERRLRRADSTKMAVMVAVITLMKPIPVIITNVATARPSVLDGVWSP